MAMDDIYTGTIQKFSSGAAAEFQYAYPTYHIHDDQSFTLMTHFRLNFTSLKTRISNLKLPKNGAPNDLTQEYLALCDLKSISA